MTRTSWPHRWVRRAVRDRIRPERLWRRWYRQRGMNAVAFHNAEGYYVNIKR